MSALIQFFYLGTCSESSYLKGYPQLDNVHWSAYGALELWVYRLHREWDSLRLCMVHLLHCC